jgi:hypothetical protein
MRKRSLVILVVLASLALLFFASGCQKSSEKEVQAAKTSLEEAKAVEADKYASDLYASAKQDVMLAESLMTAKNFKESKTYALSAKEKADSAKTMAPAKKEEFKANAEAALNDAKTKLEQFKTALKAAKKVQKATMDKLNKDATEAEAMISNAQAAFDGGDFATALNMAGGITAKIDQCNAELEAATTAKKK